MTSRGSGGVGLKREREDGWLLLRILRREAGSFVGGKRRATEQGVEGTKRRQLRFPVEHFVETTFYLFYSVQKGLKIQRCAILSRYACFVMCVCRVIKIKFAVSLSILHKNDECDIAYQAFNATLGRSIGCN